MTHEEQIASLTAMLEIQTKLQETAVDMLKPAIETAVLKEREACAKVCDQMEADAEGTECCKWPTPSDCAEAIRARSNT